MLFSTTIALAASFVRPAAQTTAITAVWANGGEKVPQDDVRASNGANVTSRIWDGSSIKQFGGRNEVVEVNLIVEAKNLAASGVNVTMSSLTGPGGAVLRAAQRPTNGLFDWTSTEIELFYVRYLQIVGASHFEYGIVPATWQEPTFPTGMKCPSGVPAGCAWTERPLANKYVPDIAVPIELVPTFTINAGQSQAIWADIYIPKTATSGLYTGTISIRENGAVTHAVPVRLTVRNFTLPDVPSSKTMMFTGYGDISLRYTGVQWPNPGTVQDALTKDVLRKQLLVAHRHKISLIDDNFGAGWSGLQPAAEWIPFLTGAAFRSSAGYVGPGDQTGQDVFAIGTYGGMTQVMGETQAAFTNQLNAWESWFEANSPSTERFVYLCDERNCGEKSPSLSTQLSWWQSISGVGRNLHTLATQPLASAVSTILSIPTSLWPSGNPSTDQPNADRILAVEPTRRLFAYNTTRPGEGSMAIEDDATSLRELPWGQYKKKVDRWFIWEGTYYNDYQNNRPMVDVFTTAETFGGATSYNYSYGMIDGGASDNGNGLFLYPGTDAIFPSASYGIDGPIASLRLKYWRRGIQDVDYLTLATTFNPTAVADLVNKMVPKVLWEVQCSDPSNCGWTTAPISWSSVGDDWENARATLADILDPPSGVSATLTANPPAVTAGQTSTLSWSSTQATTCTGSNFQTGNAASGSMSISPSTTTTYTVTCSGSSGSASASATVTVSSAPTPTATIAANPASITAGQSSVLTWSSTNASSCTGTNLSTGSAISGSVSVFPTATTTYAISCTGAGGTTSAGATVSVNTLAGLRAYWPLDEASGTTAADVSGNGNTGVLSGTPLPKRTTGRLGNALSFSGTGGFVKASASSSLNDVQSQGGGGMTVAVWIYPTSLNGSQVIVNKGRWNLGLNGNGVFGFGDFCTSGQVGSYSAANAVKLNQWNYLVATWNGTTMSSAVVLYVNGAAIVAYPQGCAGQVSSDSAYALTIGATSDNTNPAIGRIDDVRVYNAVLTASQVAALYNGTPTAKLTANPTSVASGQPSMLAWSSTNATSCVGTNFSTGNAMSGSVSVSPAATTKYAVACSGAGGTASASVTVTLSSLSGVHGLWQFSEGSGAKTADASGFGNTGTFSGTPLPTWTTGVTGSGLALAGTGGFVSVAASTSLNNLPAMTVAGWIYPTSLSGYQTIFDKGTWGFGLDGGGVFGFGRSCTTGQVGSYSPANAVKLNQWNHVVATWDGSTSSSAVVLYLNGVAIAAYPQGCSGSLSSESTNPLTVGATSYNASPLVGKIDSLQIYGRVLTASEVSTLYKMK